EGLRRSDFVAQVEIDEDQAGRALVLGDDVVIPDFFDDGSWAIRTWTAHNASLTALPTWSVVAGVPLGFKSAVTRPDASTLPTAALTAFASSRRPKVYSSMAATLPMAPNGLALFWPAMSGAEPCTGSYNPLVTPDVLAPSEADGNMPMDPARMPPMSLKMSPKVFSVRITSNWVGRSTICMAALSTNM